MTMVEPANCCVDGRAAEREAGRLEHLQPGEARDFHLEMMMLDGKVEIARYQEKVSSLMR